MFIRTHRGIFLGRQQLGLLVLQLLSFPVGAIQLGLGLDEGISHAELIKALLLGIVSGPLQVVRLLTSESIQRRGDVVVQDVIDLIHLGRSVLSGFLHLLRMNVVLNRMVCTEECFLRTNDSMLQVEGAYHHRGKNHRPCPTCNTIFTIGNP